MRDPFGISRRIYAKSATWDAATGEWVLANGWERRFDGERPIYYAAFEEQDKGSIEVGKLADFTVLSQDIMKITEPQILKTRSEMTVIGGEILYAHWVRTEED